MIENGTLTLAMSNFKNILLISLTPNSMKFTDSFLTFFYSSFVICSLIKFLISLLPSHKTLRKMKVY